MKRAPWIALAAIVVLVGVTAWSEKPPQRPDNWRPLDFTGVRTLEVVGGGSDVEFVAPYGGLGVRHPERIPPVVRRQGDRLIVSSPPDVSGYQMDVLAPATLERLVGTTDQVTTRVKVVDLEIEIASEHWFQWRGDATVLRVVSLKGGPGCKFNCSLSLGINGGDIGQLSVRLPKGTVTLGEAEDIGTIELELGEDADYELHGLHGPPPPVKLTRLGATAIAVPAPAVATPEPAAKPPRGD